MGKTGGGRGTNGYQVKGRSVMRAGSDGRHAESDVTLSTPIRRPTGLVGSDIELLLSELDAAMTAAGIVGAWFLRDHVLLAEQQRAAEPVLEPAGVEA